jgi:hypothetical protein
MLGTVKWLQIGTARASLFDFGASTSSRPRGGIVRRGVSVVLQYFTPGRILLLLLSAPQLQIDMSGAGALNQTRANPSL